MLAESKAHLFSKSCKTLSVINKTGQFGVDLLCNVTKFDSFFAKLFDANLGTPLRRDPELDNIIRITAVDPSYAKTFI